MPWLRLHITNLCNFDCPGCHVFKLSKNRVAATNMNLETASKAVDFFVSLIKKHLPASQWKTHISVYGGEPLLNRPVLYEIIQHFGNYYQEVGLNWIVNTNGSLLNEEDLAKFSTAAVDIHMSLDGREESHNKKRVDKQKKKTFGRVMKALALCKKKAYPYLQIDTVANPENIGSAQEVIEIAAESGISRIHLDLFYSPHYPQEFSAKEYARQYAGFYLKGKKKGIGIFASPFFQVYLNYLQRFPTGSLCSRFPSLEAFADGSFIFGELPLVRPFGKIDSINQNLTWEERAKLILAVDKEINQKCNGCFLFDACRGEMRRIYRYHTITTREEDIICQTAREAVKILEQNNFIPLPYDRP